MELNYQQLLFKYMQHLHKLEDSVFLELANTPFSSVHFTDEELVSLRRLEQTIEKNMAVADFN